MSLICLARRYDRKTYVVPGGQNNIVDQMVCEEEDRGKASSLDGQEPHLNRREDVFSFAHTCHTKFI